MVFQAKGVMCVNVLGRKTQGAFEGIKEFLLWLELIRERKEGNER